MADEGQYRVLIIPGFVTPEEMMETLNAWYERGYRVVTSSYRSRDIEKIGGTSAGELVIIMERI